MITDDGDALFESDAIVEYLEEAYPPLQANVTAVERARNRAWSYLASKNYLVQCGAQRSPTKEVLAERMAKFQGPLERMENHLTGAPYFAGEEIGMVDIAWLPILHRAAIVEAHSGYDFLGDRPRLKAWQETLLSDDLASRSVAPDFMEAFGAFYLSAETALGRADTPAN